MAYRAMTIEEKNKSMAYKNKCSTYFCSHRRRGYCNQEQVCEDRETEDDDYSAKLIRKNEPKKTQRRKKI